MTYKVTITKTGEPKPFWTKVVPTRADADRIVRKNQQLIDREGWKHTIAIEEISLITDDQLRDLFARHCECRPLDLTRADDDHAAIHDCDTAILHDVQVALGIVQFDDIGRGQAMREARARCTQIFYAKRNALGGWTL